MGCLKNALRDTLTGADNRTVAIGRLIGAVIAVVLLVAFPIAAAASVLIGRCDMQVWQQLFAALGLYVPLVTGAITALIWGTNTTEPKPARHDDEGARHD
jgi:hypothetical protein